MFDDDTCVSKYEPGRLSICRDRRLHAVTLHLNGVSQLSERAWERITPEEEPPRFSGRRCVIGGVTPFR